jgi:tRNA-specific 2-thiouridylase
VSTNIIATTKRSEKRAFFMKKKERVVIAMSGGVDSSVAAAVLKEAGYEVIGVSMQLWDYSSEEDKGGATEGSCCSTEDLDDARRVSDKIGIPFYVMNMQDAFTTEVVDYFVESYLKGETPNPCTKCNQELKFKTLLRKAKELDAKYLATGHYARITRPTKEGEPYRLLKGEDPNKDQSYFLFTMNQDELKSVLFPLGSLTKDEVREKARELGLRTAEKKESQEICFITDGKYANFISQTTHMENGGEIVDRSGLVLGTHEGLFRYTIGQRKGLNITAGTGPHYVLSIDTEENRLTVGAKDELLAKGLVAGNVNWIDSAPEDGTKLTAAIRYRHKGVECEVFTKSSRVEARFLTPEAAVTPGQAVVFYSGDEVVGGAWIERALK